MAKTREIRRRIRSISNISKVTKAMEMVAASKMRRAQNQVLAGRPYADKMRELLGDLAARVSGSDDEVLPLLRVRPVRRVLLIHVTADRGLAGGLVSNANRRAGQFIVNQPAGVGVPAIAVGRKGRDYLVRLRRELVAEFTNLPDRPDLADTTAISRLAIDAYANQDVDQVMILYTQFVSTMNQRPVVRQILPVEPGEDEDTDNREIIYEPSEREVLARLLPRYVEMQVYHAILENIASEWSARMVAMRSASDNATELIEALTLTYNKARQAAITTELTEIVGGAAALG